MSFQSLIQTLMPRQEEDFQESIRSRMLVFCCLIAWVGGVYALVKWSKLGHETIPLSSLLLTLIATFMLVANKFSLVSKNIIAQVMAGLVVIYMTFLVYSLGGLYSNHTYWMLATIVFVYLISGYVSGSIWSVVLIVATFIGIVMNYRYTPIPIFELDKEQQFKVALAGHLGPEIFTAIAMAYIVKLRSDTLKESQRAFLEAKSQTVTSQQLSEQLVNVIQQASLSSETLLSSATDLSGMTNRINATSSSMKSGIDQQLKISLAANQTLEEMTESVNATSVAVNTVSQNGENVREMARQSSQAMSEAVSFMDQIASGNGNIRDYVSVITGIAEQTNLLALNAAIEAARAGEHGRGFAVVADEVRNLSNRSNEAAEEISALIESSERNIEKGAEIVSSAGQQLAEVATQIDEIFEAINASALRLKTQNEGINNILSDSRAVETICQSNAASSESLLDDAALLTQVAKKLTGLSIVMSETVQKAESIEGVEASDDGGSAELF